MEREGLLLAFWQEVAEQGEEHLPGFFHPEAKILWHNTNEQFTVQEYIRANCAYPGQWQCKVERIETLGELSVTVARVWTEEEDISFHVVSFFQFSEGKIAKLEEYWGDDGKAPEWRQKLALGRPIT